MGAGPAGSIAAGTAARAGLRVVLLEEEKLPRHKACGGLLSRKALHALPSALNSKRLFLHPINEIGVCQRGNVSYYRSVEELGKVVVRASLDYELARWAVREGAILREQSPLTRLEYRENRETCFYYLSSGATTIKARYLVAADGYHSTTARLAGLQKKIKSWETGWAFNTLVKTRDTTGNCAFFYPLPLAGGFAWIFPGHNFLNVGAGGWYPFRHFLVHAFKKICAASDLKNIPDPTAWWLPFTGPLKTVTDRKRLLLAGDAAGLVDPFAGEGIYQALTSGQLAAEAIIAEAEHKVESCAAFYAREIKQMFLPAFKLSLKAALFWRWPIGLGQTDTLPGKIAAIMSEPAAYKILDERKLSPQK